LVGFARLACAGLGYDSELFSSSYCGFWVCGNIYVSETVKNQTSINLDKFFSHSSERVEITLNELLPGEMVEPIRLYSAIRWSVFAGGKRFRPSLVFAVGEVFGANESALLRTAAAIEMIHTYSLIHDDLPAMDDDELRRGRATCHVQFDEATAILAGDFLQNSAFQTIADDESLSAAIRIRLISELASASGKMVAGQQLDLDSEGKKISLNELEEIHVNKTGAMISASARAGAIIGNATDAELSLITNYAASLGLLFQITDDLIDITQTTETLGKTAGKDIAAEKATYPSIYGFEKAQRLAKEVYDSAISELDKLEHDTSLLRQLAEFILHRTA
jgi:geranylgeranyl pyrophosphate synthase